MNPVIATTSQSYPKPSLISHVTISFLSGFTVNEASVDDTAFEPKRGALKGPGAVSIASFTRNLMIAAL
jgi:hypothetical protein